jgi:hypothetical protein
MLHKLQSSLKLWDGAVMRHALASWHALASDDKVITAGFRDANYLMQTEIHAQVPDGKTHEEKFNDLWIYALAFSGKCCAAISVRGKKGEDDGHCVAVTGAFINSNGQKVLKCVNTQVLKKKEAKRHELLITLELIGTEMYKILPIPKKVLCDLCWSCRSLHQHVLPTLSQEYWYTLAIYHQWRDNGVPDIALKRPRKQKIRPLIIKCTKKKKAKKQIASDLNSVVARGKKTIKGCSVARPKSPKMPKRDKGAKSQKKIPAKKPKILLKSDKGAKSKAIEKKARKVKKRKCISKYAPANSTHRWKYEGKEYTGLRGPNGLLEKTGLCAYSFYQLRDLGEIKDLGPA